MPNVGKSTIFNALTRATIAAENYPFCTIDPNVGVVALPDSRLDRLAAIVNPQQVIPTTVEFVDIAGLVAGASKGEGLGNQFLAHIRETDAIAHVVRCFDDENIVHVAGRIDPLEDMEIINTELMLADLSTVENALQRTAKVAKSGNKEEIARKALLETVHAHLDSGLPARSMRLDDDAEASIRELHLLTMKPTMYLANVEENGFENNPLLDRVTLRAAQEGSGVVALCAAMEAEIAQLEDDEKQEFLTDLGLEAPGLDRVINAAYDLLNLRTYFTVGPKEVRAWTIPVGTAAPDAAAVIHTDFKKGFIRAEIVAFDDYVRYQGEQGARDAGKWRLEGKDYIVQDGDIIHFRFNV